MIDLSVLICSTHTRWDGFGRSIQQQVWDQYNALPPQYQDRIEILMLTDNKKMMLGHKRNVMVDMAQGRYVQFVDDDDRIEPHMFSFILDAIAWHPVDVITFGVSVSVNGAPPKLCRYSIDYNEDRNTDDGYERLPNHICVVKRELALKASFPNVLYGEDSTYSKLLLPHLKTQYEIPHETLYHYDYNGETSETQSFMHAPARRRDTDPIVDVVILSNAITPGLQSMTQQAIDTCIAGANSLPVNIIVMEQVDQVEYTNATTVWSPGEFNYNRFANRAAKYGTAEWIMIANNDLIFDDGWLHQLLLANAMIVSPKSPEDIRQADITEVSFGYENARNFSGWCFMLRRTVWEEIGGFDEDFGFWCADDAVIEQLRALKLQPALVPNAVVHHIGSVTLRRQDNHDDLTWKYVHLFNEKYGQDRFAFDLRFAEWKKANL